MNIRKIKMKTSLHYFLEGILNPTITFLMMVIKVVSSKIIKLQTIKLTFPSEMGRINLKDNDVKSILHLKKSKRI